MAQLIHKDKIILNELKYAKSIIEIGKGLMFATKNEVKRGMCLVFPSKNNKKYSCTITMLFCFFKYEILFINKDFNVVDKVVLPPFKLTYIPKKSCKYVIESLPNTFKNVKIGDKVEIKLQ